MDGSGELGEVVPDGGRLEGKAEGGEDVGLDAHDFAVHVVDRHFARAVEPGRGLRGHGGVGPAAPSHAESRYLQREAGQGVQGRALGRRLDIGLDGQKEAALGHRLQGSAWEGQAAVEGATWERGRTSPPRPSAHGRCAQSPAAIAA